MFRTVEQLELVTNPNLNVPHGFSTRLGGVSEGVYSSLNLGLSTGDEPAAVHENRRRLLETFGVTRAAACALSQVHGSRVVEAAPGWYEQEADAAVTDNPDLLLLISVADCVPLLFHDPRHNAVGAAHSGWRGTADKIAPAVIRTMGERFGSSPADIRVAIGPCISAVNYQVGAEVVAAFAEAGFPEHICRPDDQERYCLDLVAANRWLLAGAGIPQANIWDSGCCTFADPARFYSHRRDGRKRGSHWAAIRLKAAR